MATTWNLDKAHSELQFKVKHMMISNVSGSFSDFDAEVQTENDDFTTAKIHFTASIASISTKNEQRDGHLKSEDFFDAANHPKLEFTSTKFEQKNEAEYTLTGNLTIRGITKAITLDVEYGGTIKDPYGLTRAGFTVEGKINRKDFGLSWSALTETGGLVVGDDVKIHANVEFTKAV